MPLKIEGRPREALSRVVRGGGRISTATDESRESPGIAFRIPGALRTLASESEHLVAEDISGNGMRFKCRRAIPKGDVFLLALRFLPRAAKITGIA